MNKTTYVLIGVLCLAVLGGYFLYLKPKTETDTTEKDE